MSEFETVKGYLADLGLAIASEDSAEQLVVVNDPDRGFVNLVLDCESPILVVEQFLVDIVQAESSQAQCEVFRSLLKLNRTLVHGAFALDDSGSRLLFRDTLQLANLDLNELEATLNALSLALAENSAELLRIAGVNTKKAST